MIGSVSRHGISIARSYSDNGHVDRVFSSGVTGRYGRIHERRTMNTEYLSALAALAGSVVGGLTSLGASWLTQRAQFSAQVLAHDIGRRIDLYKDFIEEASKSYADAFEHDMADVPKLVHLYSLVSQMRIFSSQVVIDQADRIMLRIVETYRGPNKSIRDMESHDLKSGVLDPLLDFSNACRDELRMQEVSPRNR